MTRVLIVDDERGLRRALGINLKARGYDVTLAADGKSALEAASRHPPDVVVLDLGLPDIDGIGVIEGLRGWTEAPILVLSARSGEPDKVSPSTPEPTTSSQSLSAWTSSSPGFAQRCAAGRPPTTRLSSRRRTSRSIWRPNRYATFRENQSG